MKPDEREKLLKEILPREDIADFRQTSLAGGLTFLRRRRQSRHLRRAGTAGLMLCFVTFGIFLISRRPPRENSASPPSTVASQPSPAASHVTFISDEELLALFPDRPVALIGKPGQQRLVFLDKPHNEPDRSPF